MLLASLFLLSFAWKVLFKLCVMGMALFNSLPFALTIIIELSSYIPDILLCAIYVPVDHGMLLCACYYLNKKLKYEFSVSVLNAFCDYDNERVVIYWIMFTR